LTEKLLPFVPEIFSAPRIARCGHTESRRRWRCDGCFESKIVFPSAMHAAVTAEQFCDKTNVRFIGAIGSGGKRWNAWLATPWRPSTTPACCNSRKRSRRRIRSDRAQGSDRLRLFEQNFARQVHALRGTESIGGCKFARAIARCKGFILSLDERKVWKSKARWLRISRWCLHASGSANRARSR
jgi:hypothetical protein